jgi:hypothetical protein
VRLWPFGRKPKREHYLGEYTEPSFRGAVLMLVVSLVVITLLWLAYGWALGQQGVPDPEAAGGVTAALTTAFAAG